MFDDADDDTMLSGGCWGGGEAAMMISINCNQAGTTQHRPSCWRLLVVVLEVGSLICHDDTLFALLYCFNK
jgi:hypothetical protein